MITKELAIKILSGDTLGTNEQTHEAVCMAVKALTEQKQGHWIMKPNGYGTCSNCNKCSLDIMGGVHSNFCPNCGAKMDEPPKDET